MNILCLTGGKSETIFFLMIFADMQYCLSWIFFLQLKWVESTAYRHLAQDGTNLKACVVCRFS